MINSVEQLIANNEPCEIEVSAGISKYSSCVNGVWYSLYSDDFLKLRSAGFSTVAAGVFC